MSVTTRVIKTVRWCILVVMAFDAFAALAQAVDERTPTYDSLKQFAREFNEMVRGDERTQAPPLRVIDPDRVARGARLYRANCVQCHGENAQGAPNWQRRDAVGNYPPPPLDGSAHTWHHPMNQLLEMIRNGGTVMPAFGSRLGDEDIEDVIHWFQSLWPEQLYRRWAQQDEASKRNAD